VHELTLIDQDRTNNKTEGWNHRFSELAGHEHPTIWTLVTKIRLEVAVNETNLAQHNIGTYEHEKTKNMYDKMQKKLKTVCEKYDNGNCNIKNFLKSVSNIINYNKVILRFV